MGGLRTKLWLASQLKHQRDGYVERHAIEVGADGDIDRIEHRFQHVFDLQAERRTSGVPVAIEMLRVLRGVALTAGLEIANPTECVTDRVHIAAQYAPAWPRHTAQLGERSPKILKMPDNQAADRQIRP